MSNIQMYRDRYDSHMDLRQLRYFVAVAEELHFGRAAERVGIAQPPLTQQIQKLERTLGCSLFVRGRKTVLTDPGRVLLQRAKLLLSQADAAIDATQRSARGETGELTIGVPPSVMLLNYPAAIRKYRDRYPDISFILRELSTSAIEDAVRSGTIDLGFLRETRPAAPLVSEVVLREPIVAVLPSSHPLARRNSLRLASLKGEPFVLFPRRLGPALYDHLAACCDAAGFTPNVVQEATQWQTVVSLVEAGMGVSIAPGCVRNFRWRGVAYPLIPGCSTAVSACWRTETPSPTADAFLRIVKAMIVS
jgi:LysR family transcriptional regulator, benzoate and cis,cis-muconate-responsive activator of ben and cat genes